MNMNRSYSQSEFDSMPILAIGLSTGGTESLSYLLGELPNFFPMAIVVVQHVSVDFSGSLVQSLAQSASLPVRAIKGGEIPQAGEILVAATNNHLIMRKDGSLHYTSRPDSIVCKPSVDVFFQSLAARKMSEGIAVLLTGMGNDGALGMLALKENGWRTIAEDESTCTVFGMPKAALELGAAKESIALHDMPAALFKI